MWGEGENPERSSPRLARLNEDDLGAIALIECPGHLVFIIAVDEDECLAELFIDHAERVMAARKRAIASFLGDQRVEEAQRDARFARRAHDVLKIQPTTRLRLG